MFENTQTIYVKTEYFKNKLQMKPKDVCYIQDIAFILAAQSANWDAPVYIQKQI